MTTEMENLLFQYQTKMWLPLGCLPVSPKEYVVLEMPCWMETLVIMIGIPDTLVISLVLGPSLFNLANLTPSTQWGKEACTFLNDPLLKMATHLFISCLDIEERSLKNAWNEKEITIFNTIFQRSTSGCYYGTAMTAHTRTTSRSARMTGIGMWFATSLGRLAGHGKSSSLSAGRLSTLRLLGHTTLQMKCFTVYISSVHHLTPPRKSRIKLAILNMRTRIGMWMIPRNSKVL